MKITDVEVMCLRIPTRGEECVWGEDAVLVRITTDTGIVGFGEADTSPMVVRSFIETPNSNLACFGLRELLIGENPLEIQRLWDKMYESSSYAGRRGAGIHAISAVDIALWDIASQHYQQPIHMLLGGKYRDRIKAYGTFIPADKPEDNKALARELLDKGFTGMKFGGGLFGNDFDHDLNVIKAVREEVGDDVTLMVDLVSRWRTFGNALSICRKLEKYNLEWVEEPIPSDDLDGYSRLAAAATQKVAGGEILSTRYEFKDFIERGRPDIVQPDITRCGGISEMARIRDIADLNGVQLVPHGFSTGILLAATVQFLAASKHGTLIEYSQSDSPLFTDLVGDLVPLEDGYVPVSDTIGLGSQLNWDLINQYRIDY
ncbi:mandelate racemase/muconate lactonizing enzyme family protein [Halodesulfovibrio marinisediminis]|uniref:L-alanine-DL-glutamate epimerase n=1 Tax=Halodesulfovibrio marinisediminis DSM 17456 TaxID=1121457 RepID=A0A1N6DVT9_9BACT|nr:mandelate racemase/muconate lactonizing enzyme family protein [Halodesulfovibrio marinisediminis]SIN74881.1 L-alanine-DL-glutamate epimerase [Halodesulfovibrio marinisediminis DSM 17456]